MGPWGAGMFATSLGPHDACFVMGANEQKGSGYTVNWWLPAAIQKEFIETSKVDECRNRWIGTLIWHFVHHTPVHLWGKAPAAGSEPGGVAPAIAFNLSFCASLTRHVFIFLLSADVRQLKHGAQQLRSDSAVDEA